MFRLTLIPTLITLPALVILLALGSWQVQRLYWKQDLIDALQSRSVADPQALPASPLNETDHEFLQVSVTGVYDHAREFHLLNRSLNGRPGVNILTPLKQSDGSVVLINRGWVPFEVRQAESRQEGLLPGTVTVTGLLRFVKPQSWIQKVAIPENEPENNAWFTIDAAGMSAFAGYPIEADYYIMSGNRTVPGGYPVGQQWRVDIRNDHFEYALTWFGLALGLVGIYLAYHWRRPAADS